jgi:TonB family protein
MWLSEGLAEYFATAQIDDTSIYVGSVSNERIRLLKSVKLIPLNQFLNVDQSSPHYNETQKANAFYAQAWAFVHFLHNRHAAAFRQYIDALREGPADIFDYIKMTPRALQTDFENYVDWPITLARGMRVQAERERWTMTIQPIPDAEAQMSISEIFIAMGRLEAARSHLEAIDALDAEFPRAAYYRGVLARISDDRETARDSFVDALLDEQIGPRAAVSLVQIGEMDIPSVRSTLEQAASANTRMSDVYWALSEIYLEDIRRIEETVALAADSEPLPSRPIPVDTAVPPPAAEFTSYSEGMAQNIKYELFTDSALTPGLHANNPPYYPEELLADRVGGRVVVDLQVADDGAVAGLWLVSATPDVFASLATTAVRQWRFEPMAARVRVIFDFVPGP